MFGRQYYCTTATHSFCKAAVYLAGVLKGWGDGQMPMFNVASWFGQSSYVPALVFYVLSVCLFVRLPVCVCSRELEPSPGTL